MESIPAVVDALERAPAVVVPLVREVPAAVLRRRPRSGKWSVHEHACHLAVVHGLFFQRLEHMLVHPAPVITPYDPGTQDPDDSLLRLDLDESLESFARDRERLVARIRDLAPSDWRKSADHAEYSHYSVFIMFRHLALHDFFHAYRIEELLLNREWTTERLEGAQAGSPRQEVVMNRKDTGSSAAPDEAGRAGPHGIVGVHGVRYQVKDVARAVTFYTERLGFKLEHQQPPAFASVSLGAFTLLLSGPGASGSRPIPGGKRQEPGGWNRVVLRVSDLPARIEALKKAGVTFRNQMEVGPGGRQVQVEDPEGNPIELFEPAR